MNYNLVLPITNVSLYDNSMADLTRYVLGYVAATNHSGNKPSKVHELELDCYLGGFGRDPHCKGLQGVTRVIFPTYQATSRSLFSIP